MTKTLFENLWSSAFSRSGPVAPGTGGGQQIPVVPPWISILDGLPDPVFVLNRFERLIAANLVSRQTFNAGLGRHISLTFRSTELLGALKAARASGKVEVCRTRLLSPIERVIDCSITPLQNIQSDDDPAFVIVLRDKTTELQQAELRADFVANASHELRTPLASLSGFIETLRTTAKDDALAREQFLEIMQDQARRMSRLIDDLLSLSRIEMRQHVMPKIAVNMADVASETVKALAPIAARQQIALTSEAAPERLLVSGDREELMQLTQNLIQNGIRYGNPGGFVRVELKRDGRWISLSVRDNGIGIAAEHIPRLTERFYRVNARDSRERGGTGLGLAIVKHIVNRHQGELRIVSTPGQGSVFTVLLPANNQ